MGDSPTLDELVAVSPRFARSISLVRDASRTDALQGYILTPTGRDVLHRLSDALRGDSPTRAWSITGPYGSGKSAFALFAAQLLSGEADVRYPARKFLAAHDADLSERFFGTSGPLPRRAGRLCPVLVTGSRQPLEKALASSLASSLRAIAQRGRPPQIVERLERIAEQTTVSGTGIVGLFEEAADYLDRFGHAAAGILLIVDELGKFLEYGATNPDQGDVFVLQEVAEAATRSKRPFLFITVLHQAIDRYAEHMSGGAGPNGRRCKEGSRMLRSRSAPSRCCDCSHARSGTRGTKPASRHCAGTPRYSHRKLVLWAFTSARWRPTNFRTVWRLVTRYTR